MRVCMAGLQGGLGVVVALMRMLLVEQLLFARTHTHHLLRGQRCHSAVVRASQGHSVLALLLMTLSATQGAWFDLLRHRSLHVLGVGKFQVRVQATLIACKVAAFGCERDKLFKGC